MSINALLRPLNAEQAQAVTSADKYLLVLAGAGSGKTRVLTHRMAYHVLHRGIPKGALLAVTFTNKAAGEMRSRLAELLGTDAPGWVGTFHSLSHRLLRQFYKEASLPQTFQIIDTDDQQKLIKRILKQLEIDDKLLDAREAQRFINAQKEQGLRSDKLSLGNDRLSRLQVAVYEAYESFCEKSGLLDFAEILLRTYELLRDNETIRNSLHMRFQEILVDEFQDTNTIQYRWLKLLVGPEAGLTIVGDDDQSIYGWRGAKIENIQRFPNDFRGAVTVRLEQNYRSTGTILSAANALIANNGSRLGKNLWTADKAGEHITLYQAYDERDEAYFVVSNIDKRRKEGATLKEIAVLYRSNAQSRVFEEALVRARLPYRIFGGLRFFERAEIKDALAYCRLAMNPDDDASFLRVINVPRRGIGEKTIEDLQALAVSQQSSVWQALKDQPKSANKIGKALQGFQDLIEGLQSELTERKLSEWMRKVVHESGLMALYALASSEKEKIRTENLEELVNATAKFEEEADERVNTEEQLLYFLAAATLDTGDESNPDDNVINLMTLHSAKGLEFEEVFLVGLEENLFPSAFSGNDLTKLEEERRLCYVGITRARHNLTLSFAERRAVRGFSEQRLPSRFLKEIPSALVKEAGRKFQVMRSMQFNATPTEQRSAFRLGQRVKHAKFGEGVVLGMEGIKEHAKVQVQFQSGVKWLLVGMAHLEVL